MRSEIERIQCELGVTTLYGARDQVEAIRHVRQSEWAIPSVRVRADWCVASAPGTGVSAVAVEPACPATAMMTTIAAAVGRYLLFASMVLPSGGRVTPGKAGVVARLRAGIKERRSIGVLSAGATS